MMRGSGFIERKTRTLVCNSLNMRKHLACFFKLVSGGQLLSFMSSTKLVSFFSSWCTRFRFGVVHCLKD